MNNIFNRRTVIILLSLAIIICLVLGFRAYLSARPVQASVTPADVELGVPIQYADSTKSADRWLWEFGNGDTSEAQSGEYTYPTTGKYQIRLTVDGKLEKKFIVNIRPVPQESPQEQLIEIVAPSAGLESEWITFRGEGSSKEWRWEFGETGMVDARERTAIYRYSEPGEYEVLLSTEETQYPIRHKINIEPRYTEADTTNIETMISNEVKEKLQAIIDQKPFNSNYNYILKTYLCNNPNTLVVVNNSKKNDFYSYCQGLKIIGRKRTIIENVLFDWDKDYCIVKLIVIQTERE
ncbi:MAG: PKD domain-containing protein [Bacteroidales bacterium]|jgi:hypothetical protein|nr:PKD domain-containing protein [Bacteroidales bacterium]